MNYQVSEQPSTKPVVSPIDPTTATQGPISTKPLVSDKTRRTTVIVSVIVGLLILVLLGGLIFVLYKSYDWAAADVVPATVRLRDIGIVLMALETMVLLVLTLIVIVMLMIVIVLLYDRVIPILEQINRTINTAADTVHTVRGTTTFVSEKVVTPLISLSGMVAGIARIGKGIVDLFPSRAAKRRERSRISQE